MTTLTARIDGELGARITSVRPLRYSAAAAPGDDRPPHPRAASGLAWLADRLAVVQDDAAFIATVAGDDVAAIALPRGPGDRRRFEVGLGNKHHKLDLEACVAGSPGELWLFGSGSTPAREQVAVVTHGQGIEIVDAAALYARARGAIGGAINVEGVARVADELWLFHRGNTGAGDRGPAVIRFACAALTGWLGGGGVAPPATGCTWIDLGAIAGVRLGFTDAVALGARVFYLAVAEASPNAIDDGRVVGSQLGVIDGSAVRATPLALDGVPVKAEGLAFADGDGRRAWIAIDPDDVDVPAQLCELALTGPW